MRKFIKSHFPDKIRILRLCLYEWQAFWAHLCGKLSIRQRSLIRQLRGRTDLRINIAGGTMKFPGYTNVDASPAADIRMDLRKPLPLADNSVQYLFTEHFCDHLNFPDVIGRFLNDCHRVLRADGVARFVMHDAEGMMKAAVEKDDNYFKVGELDHPTRMESVNLIFRFNDMHQFMYDFELFAKLLTQAGFSSVKRCHYRQSDHPDLLLDFVHPHREMLSMYIEATK
jgi:predicted SAM-dependent methyltransferase